MGRRGPVPGGVREVLGMRALLRGTVVWRVAWSHGTGHGDGCGAGPAGVFGKPLVCIHSRPILLPGRSCAGGLRGGRGNRAGGLPVANIILCEADIWRRLLIIGLCNTSRAAWNQAKRSMNPSTRDTTCEQCI